MRCLWPITCGHPAGTPAKWRKTTLPRDDLRTAVNKPVYSLVPFRSPCEDFLPPPPPLLSPHSPHFTDPHDAQLHVKMRSRHRLTSDPRHLTCAVSPDSLDTLFLAVIARFPRSEWRRWQARWPLSLLLSVGCYYHPRSALGASQKTIVSSGTEGYKPPLWARGPRAGHLRGLDGLGPAPPCALVSSSILHCLDYQLYGHVIQWSGAGPVCCLSLSQTIGSVESQHRIQTDRHPTVYT